MNEAYIVSASRTPIGRFNGSLSLIPATRLGSIVIEDAFKKANLSPDIIDGVIMGNVISSGLGSMPARRAALGAGLPKTVNACLINSGGASGMQAVIYAAQSILSGNADIMIAGGMENMSKAPYLLEKARFGYKIGDGTLVDAIIIDGLRDAESDYQIGEVAELAAKRFSINRADQDAFALKSYGKAILAQGAGNFEEEIVQIMLPLGRDKFASLNMDEEPQRHDPERLKSLHPLFREGGTITSGNSAEFSDGAAALCVASGKTVKRLGLFPAFKVAGWASVGVEQDNSPIAAGYAIDKLLKSKGLKKSDVDLFEINEEFSVSIIALMNEFGFDEERLNTSGGSIAIGNPIGAVGARIITTLVKAMKWKDVRRGVAAIAAGSGEASALLIEKVEKF